MDAPPVAIVIGSGFGGAVTACRLAEADYKVTVLERGRRYEKGDFPRYPTDAFFSRGEGTEHSGPPVVDLSRWLWKRDQGIYDVRDLEDVVSVQAAGYGGGSLIYANVHLRPPREVFARWPAEYHEGKLDPYFDLAALMLQVKPIPRTLAKTSQLFRAANALNSEAFLTPLAVNFERCDLRGRCCLGCDQQAKNTLDMNYLERAEKAGATIMTLAEVSTIKRHDNGKFTVTYCDLLERTHDGRHEERHLEGDYVFLCAGAINTTQLLLRSRKSLNPNGHWRALGSHYFPNSDSLAAVFDCDEPHQADYGPTITAALVHESTSEGTFSHVLDFCEGSARRRIRPGATVSNDAGAKAVLAYEPVKDWGSWKGDDAAGALVLSSIDGQTNPPQFEAGEKLTIDGHATVTVRSSLVTQKHWFLAEDGGYPPDLQPLVGMFRSPLWLRRNRYIEDPSTLKESEVPHRPAAPRLRFEVVSAALRGTAARAVSTGGVFSRSFNWTAAPAASAAAVAPGAGAPAGPAELFTTAFATFFPPWFTRTLLENRNAVVDQAGVLALPMVGGLLDRLAIKAAKQIDQDTLAGFARAIGRDEARTVDRDDSRKVVLIRGLLRQAVQILGGSEAEVAATAANLLLDPVPATPEALVRSFGQLLLWALAYGETDEHTGIVLTMGRDLYRGRLYLQAGMLKARLPGRALESSAAMQERVLRVIASEGWGGELRTNPAWATFDRRLTVHSQGGCPMGESWEYGVTDGTGRVHECEGLYVMDAAAFPTSVGANPSATILAVAEYKIEQFLKSSKKSAKAVAALTDERNAAVAWAKPQRASLDPLNVPRPAAVKPPRAIPPVPKVLGLKFKETMRGFFTDVAPNQATLGEQPYQYRHLIPQYVAAEDRGMRQCPDITLTLDATIDDLGRLVSADPKATPLHIRLSGSVKMDDQRCEVKDGSSLQMFIAPSPRRPERFFRYSVCFDDGDFKNCRLTGTKVLSNESNLDMWLDTSTLYFDLTRGTSQSRGILRVSLQDFLQVQLPSMDVTGTEDPTRKSWALVAFYKYFGGELSRIYAPRAETVVRLFAKAMTNINV